MLFSIRLLKKNMRIFLFFNEIVTWFAKFMRARISSRVSMMIIIINGIEEGGVYRTGF